MTEVKACAPSNGASQFDMFNSLNRSITPGSVFVTPNGDFGVKTDDGRVMTFGDNGAVDVTDIAEIVNHVEIRTTTEALPKKALFIFDNAFYQVIEDKTATIDAFCFNTKAVVTVSPERLVMMGNVRAIGVVFMPEAKAFGGDMFQALKILAASAGDRDGLYSLRKKEWMAAQLAGKTVETDGLDEMMALAANPGAAQFQSLMAIQQQTAVLANIANSLKAIAKCYPPTGINTCDCERKPDNACDQATPESESKP